jgi:hypothetical protein
MKNRLEFILDNLLRNLIFYEVFIPIKAGVWKKKVNAKGNGCFWGLA